MFGIKKVIVELPEALLLELYFKDKLIATYYQDKITPNILIDGCENYLKSITRGF